MNLNSFRSLFFKGSAVLASTAVVAAMTGCGLGTIQAGNSTDTIVPALHGVVHGGVSPDVGARVVLYATTSNGYGQGAFLQEATQVGASAHQDTDSNGGFSFTGGYVCPAGQYAYIANYGGNAGGGVNPNIVMITALGPCSGLLPSTFIYISEATTVAAAYALSNFINVTGNAVSGYTVGIGAPATNNNGTTGCVSNAYYTTVTCPATQAAGLGHAFNNATGLVNTSNGTVNSTMNNGASVPTQEINTLADILQACVNSTGGGTDGSTGLPTTTTTVSGTSHDGTACGKLSAFTSYTNNGLSSGTLTAAGNTLDAVKNLVKRPAGSASTFNGTCDSNSGGGTTTAASCLFGLVNGVSAAFVPALSAAPGDWMLGISYPKAGLSNSTSNTFTTGASCAVTTANNGLFYAWWVASDINDDIVILNGDASTIKCADIIAIGPDGTIQGISTIDNVNLAGAVSLALDAWGHAVVPVSGLTTARFYQYNAQGTANGSDSSIPFLSAVTTNTAKPTYAEFDANSRLYATTQGATSGQPWEDFSVSGTPGVGWHTAVTYGSPVNLGSSTSSSLLGVAIDINSNAFSLSSSKIYATDTSGTATPASVAGASASTEMVLLPDTTGNLWNIVNNSTTATEVIKYTYTTTSTPVVTATASIASPTYTFSGTVNTGPKAGVMDGNNVLWFADFAGSTGTYPTTGGFIRGYDTVNNYGTPVLQGCKVLASGGTIPITAWSISGSNTTFSTSNTTAPPVGAIMTLSGFTTGSFFNNVQVTVVAPVANGSPSTFTVASNFSQGTSNATENGTGTGRTPTACGSNVGDTSSSNTPFLVFQSRGIAVDTMGNLWVANGAQAQVNEILGIAAPTWPNYIHNGTSNKP